MTLIFSIKMASNNINSSEDILDDDLDECTVPKKSDPTSNTTSYDEPDLSSMDFSKILGQLQGKSPKELRKMISKMGVSQQQINQMRKSYENSSDNTNNTESTETDLRKRLREKLNKKKLMRQTNAVKKQHMENESTEKEVTPAENNNIENKTDENVEEIIIDSEPTTTTTPQVSKKTLQNRKKAQRKKEKKAELKAGQTIQPE